MVTSCPSVLEPSTADTAHRTDAAEARPPSPHQFDVPVLDLHQFAPPASASQPSRPTLRHRPDPTPRERREEVVTILAAGVLRLHRAAALPSPEAAADSAET